METEGTFSSMEELPFEVKCLIVDFLGREKTNVTEFILISIDAVSLCKLSQTSLDWNFVASNSLRWCSLLLAQFGARRHERTVYLYNCKILEGNKNILWLDADDELCVLPSSNPPTTHEEPLIISKGKFFKKMYAGLLQFFSWHNYDIPTLVYVVSPSLLTLQSI